MNPHEVSCENAYTVARALQKACKGQVVSVSRQPLKSDRLLFEFQLDEGGTVQSTTAYSEGFFDEATEKDLTHLAQRIYEELTERFKWLQKSKSKEHKR